MSKELEALEKFLDDYLTLCEKLHTNRQEKMLLDKNSPYNVLKQGLLKSKKELEALEIIKEKQVDTEHIRICFSNEKGGFTEYNDWVELDTCRELTEEEYELLRKVLE